MKTIRQAIEKVRLICTNSIFILTSVLVMRPLLVLRRDRQRPKDNAVLCVSTMFLGDVILASDFLRFLSASKKYSSHYLVVRNEYGPLCATLFPAWGIITIEMWRYRLNPFYRLWFLRKLRELRLKTAVNISIERGVINDELVTFSDAQERIALHDFGEFLYPAFDLFNNMYYTHFLHSESNNEYSRLVELLPMMGIDRTHSNSFTSTQLKDASAVSPVRPGRPFIVVAPLALHKDKSWPATSYEQLCGMLSEKIDVIIVGSPKQKAILLAFEKGTSIRNMAGSLPLEELPGLLAQCTLFIGNDSGTTHLAHMLGVPTIAIVGGGAWGRFFPYGSTTNIRYLFREMDCFGCNWNCKYEKNFCLTDVSVGEVSKAALEMIGHTTE